MKKILIFGTFDVIHPGHKFFLKKARQKGDTLVAVVSRDSYVREWKGHDPIHNQEERIRHLESSALVDKAVLSDEIIGSYRVVEEENPQIICLGHDQFSLLDSLAQWLDQQGGKIQKTKIIVLSPWKRGIYSSTRQNGRGKKTRAARQKGTLPLSLALVLAMGLWGFSWVMGKMLTTTTSLNTVIFWRFLLSTASFLPTLFFVSSPGGNQPLSVSWKVTLQKAAWLAGAAGALVLYNRFFFGGLARGLAGKGGVIVTTLNPLFIFLFVLFLSRSLPKLRQGMGLLLGLAGGVLLMEPWGFSLGEWGDKGNLFFLGGAAVWAVLTLLSRRGQQIAGFFWFNFLLYAMAALLSLPSALTAGPLLPLEAEGDFWLMVFYMAVLAGSLGTGIFFLAAKRLGAFKAGAFTFLVPFTAMASSALVLGEKPQVLTILGGILAILAVILVNAPEADSRR